MSKNKNKNIVPATTKVNVNPPEVDTATDNQIESEVDTVVQPSEESEVAIAPTVEPVETEIKKDGKQKKGKWKRDTDKEIDFRKIQEEIRTNPKLNLV